MTPAFKNILRHLYFCLITSVTFFACGDQKQADQAADTLPTQVYLVRHAEKDLSDTTDNPALTPQGLARAQKLAEVLDTVQLAAIYSTRYQRNINTVQPLADKKGLQIQLYEAQDFSAVAKLIAEKHQGQTVLICGHSNTIIPLISQLGAKPPQDSIASNEYDKLFRLVFATDDTLATASQF